MVNPLALYSNDPSSNPDETTVFAVKCCIKEKEDAVGLHLKRKKCYHVKPSGQDGL